MAFSAHKTKEEVREYETDDVNHLNEQAAQVAKWIQESKHFVVFTGAGVSTSAGIPDFRGPQGCWTLKAEGKPPPRGVDTISALPTPSHMALVALQKAGYLKFLITQNCDGIHRRSGFPKDKLAELHGNTMLEHCPKCKRQYLRDFHCSRHGNHVHNHVSGRFCAICGLDGPLEDSIINFGENLPTKELNAGWENSKQADLCIVLGSSLTVTPAADLPKSTQKAGGRLVIVNLQKTPLDDRSALRVFARTDQFMSLVMQHLNLRIPSWILERRVRVTAPEATYIQFSGESRDGLPDSFMRHMCFIKNGTVIHKSTHEPFKLKNEKLSGVDEFVIEFMGHYNEPAFNISMAPIIDRLSKQVGSGINILFQLSFNPNTGQWTNQILSG